MMQLYETIHKHRLYPDKHIMWLIPDGLSSHTVAMTCFFIVENMGVVVYLETALQANNHQSSLYLCSELCLTGTAETVKLMADISLWSC